MSTHGKFPVKNNEYNRENMRGCHYRGIQEMVSLDIHAGTHPNEMRLCESLIMSHTNTIKAHKRRAIMDFTHLNQPGAPPGLKRW